MATADLSSHQNTQTLYVEHLCWLKGWLKKKLGCTDQAADLAQDTFVRVLLQQNRTAIREPRAYLTTVASGLVIDHWRKQDIERGWIEAMTNQPEVEVPSPEQRLLIWEALYRVDRMLSELPLKVREAFLCSQVQGMTYMAIAEQLKVSERMVKKYMAQAMLACIALEI